MWGVVSIMSHITLLTKDAAVCEDGTLYEVKKVVVSSDYNAYATPQLSVSWGVCASAQ